MASFVYKKGVLVIKAASYAAQTLRYIPLRSVVMIEEHPFSKNEKAGVTLHTNCWTEGGIVNPNSHGFRVYLSNVDMESSNYTTFLTDWKRQFAPLTNFQERWDEARADTIYLE